MKRTLTLLVFIVAFATTALAQQLNLKPGLYAYDSRSGKHIAVEFTRTRRSGFGTSYAQLSRLKLRHPHAEARAESTFILVTDPDASVSSLSRRKQVIFTRHFTPDQLRLVKLHQKKRKRILYSSLGNDMLGIDLGYFRTIEFQWQEIALNTYKITVPNIVPGEYAFQFTFSPGDPYEESYVLPFGY